MFTGIVEEKGQVIALNFPDEDHQDAQLTITAPHVVPGTRLGESIAVNGVCLTVTELAGENAFVADVMPETLRLTTLGSLTPGDSVNLERARLIGSRLDGHIVQGHVDGVAHLLSRHPGPRWDDLWFALPSALAPYVARKGSIALAGVSLTVTEVTASEFGVSLIPTTLEATILGDLQPGQVINVEVDVIAKYVERLLHVSALE
ncbi:MAG: riboflavin synthase [Ancrocorticia sp.]|jgi:riboflavin synthase|nr:riboflavin synthase [Ancrocorticia sp.]